MTAGLKVGRHQCRACALLLLKHVGLAHETATRALARSQDNPIQGQVATRAHLLPLPVLRLVTNGGIGVEIAEIRLAANISNIARFGRMLTAQSGRSPESNHHVVSTGINCLFEAMLE